MFPIAILIATTAMASGVGGATFFAPIFILGLRLEPNIAIGTGLITEVFGFASGLLAYYRQGLIDYRLGVNLVLVTVPMAVIGTLLAGQVDPEILKTILGIGLFTVAISFLRAPSHEDITVQESFIMTEYGGQRAETVIIDATGDEIRYTVCNRAEGQLIAGIGGLFVGLISTGLGELNGYFLLQRCRVPSKVAVATSIFVVAITAVTASLGHMAQFIQAGGDEVNVVLSITIFTVPGVVIGGQIGSVVASKISQKSLESGLGVLFVIIAVLTLGEVIL